MPELALNLARKWRSQSFDQVVGQELVVRLLKNSLYRDMLMPVYLLAGMRGCGKTSIGRLFAAALNCELLATFRKQPQETSLPCWNCLSCRAVQKSQHPDFIEIDAASHTGVDNIRNLIDIASFVPALGTKKIYLIDEAHMLSKAAFNALLKILEEPPLSVVFMLATTDSHKVPDTVRSRCFQLFFKPIVSTELVKHLAFVCAQEQISYDTAGLELVAQESEGSARDALNLIERVRLSHEAITKDTLTQVLGFLDDEKLIDLFQAFLHKDPPALLQLCNSYNLAGFNMQILWKKLILLVRTALLIKHKLPVDNFANYQEKIAQIIQSCSVDRLVACLDLCYAHELSFTRTAMPYPLFEMLLIKLCSLQHDSPVMGLSSNKTSQNLQSSSIGSSDVKKKLVLPPSVALTQAGRESRPDGASEASARDAAADFGRVIALEENTDSRWKQFMQLLEATHDHMLNALFKQSRFMRFIPETKLVEVQFSENQVLFKDTIDVGIIIWQPLLVQAFGPGATCVMQFTAPAIAVSGIKSQAAAVARAHQPTAEKTTASVMAKSAQPINARNSPTKYTRQTYEPKPKEVAVSITDSEKWPKAVLLSKIFPGTLTQVKS